MTQPSPRRLLPNSSLALLNVREDHVSIASDRFNIAPLLLITGVLGSIFVLATAQLFTAKWIEFIGRQSFDFMAIHSLIRTAVTFAMTAFLSVDFWAVNTEYRYTLPMLAIVLGVTYGIVLIKCAVGRRWAERKQAKA